MSFYLFVVFSLFVVYKSVILAEQHISFVLHGFALINALALAKVMLVAQELHWRLVPEFSADLSDTTQGFCGHHRAGLFQNCRRCYRRHVSRQVVSRKPHRSRWRFLVGNFVSHVTAVRNADSFFWFHGAAPGVRSGPVDGSRLRTAAFVESSYCWSVNLHLRRRTPYNGIRSLRPSRCRALDFSVDCPSQQVR
jgi:hypothetical protein